MSVNFPPSRGGEGQAALLSELREAYTAALILGEEVGAEVVVREALEAGLDEATIQEEVLTPSLRRVGDLWERGSLTVADEHLATQITLRVLALGREAERVATGRRQKRVMLAGVEGEEHIVGLRMASELLTSGGYETLFLGSDVPIDSLAQIVEKHRPNVLALTATMPESGGLLRLAIDEARRGDPGLSLLVGGQGVPREFRGGEGVSVAAELSGVIETVDALIRRPGLN
ncbi:MAG: hypothetical protein AVDCRST_MAG17-1993 [uncultured Solirubrobacterales bacterium]|uniref:B12-binding domain-containing protein n=1 Tax=uncultured Solirubrobacterales bacterium TaxID=768556 RepID=A0A6J4T2S7_9ACTN|nr:MAG: hypothetical protein AVDCRST_MAG17-1993 [uncultured Solirubrobacterales bacterium]